MSATQVGSATGLPPLEHLPGAVGNHQHRSKPPDISIERWVRDGVGRTIEVTDYWFDADVPPRPDRRGAGLRRRGREREHRPRRLLQAGLGSGAVSQGRLMRESEQLIADFQARVHAALA